MTYDSNKGEFIGEVEPWLIGDGLVPGDYWAYKLPERREEAASGIPFKLVQDYTQ